MTNSGESPYRFQQFEGHAVITLLPQLNESQWADIERVGTEVVDQLKRIDHPRFLVDLSQLNYMGSAMVALIVRFWKSVKDNKKGRMVVVNQDEMVFEVLKLAGLHNVWTIVQNEEEGRRALGVSGRSAAGESRFTAGGGMLPTVVGAVAVLGALIALALILSGSQAVSNRLALAVEFVFAAIGLIVGMISAVRESDWRQQVGIGVVAASVILVFVGILTAPGGSSGAAPAEPSPQSQQSQQVQAPETSSE